ncbi:DNA repair protein RecO [Clostridium thermarum]|uniref:DNA repair protein RecO n=1 Tax=Clostridium thermarum TaxID=1716543 RepID=UPI0013CFF391|nr:DNA repair protein RecO [Clostridium thermarum]
MSVINCKAVVLKVSDYGENDKIVWLFTDKLGKISAIAKGAKKSKSKLFSITLPFCFGEYTVFRGKSMYVLSEGKTIESFQALLNDLDTLTYGSYICELVDISMVDEESNRDIFKTLVSSLYLLKSRAVDDEILLRAYELNVLNNTGYGINFETCGVCRKKIEQCSYISLQQFGGVCDQCPKTDGISISKPAFKVLKFLNNIPLEKVYRLTVPQNIKRELKKTLQLFISNNYSRIPKSLQMLDFIKESE